MKVSIATLGCKVNSYESEAVLEQLVSRGYTAVDFTEKSDIYIINTCMVTNTAEAKSRKIVHRPLKLNPDAIIVVMGCWTQLKAEEVLAIPGVKIVLGTIHREHIPDFIEEYLRDKVPLNKVSSLTKDIQYDKLLIEDFKSHHRAFLKIQDGCNNYCTYCIIPYTRGRVRSKPKEQVLLEAKELVKHGHYEIILTGIHTGGYGEDLKEDTFGSLLEALESIEGLKRIRISSIEISELTEEVIDLIANSKKIVNHLHIPLQGGTNRILKLMNRKYTLEDYSDKIKDLRQKIKNLAITTDIIAGFPTETDKDHVEALEFISKIGFSELHVFPYSKRNGTLSAKMTPEVDGVVKKARVQDFLKLSTVLAKAFIQSQIGKLQEVVFETEKDGYLEGHTSNYILVKAIADRTMIGEVVNVKITQENYPVSIAKIQ